MSKLFRDDYSELKTSVEHAYRIDPASWRTCTEMIKAIVKENQIDKALQIADKNFKSHPGNCKAKRIEDFSFETPSSGSLKIIPPDNKIHLPVLPPTSMVGL